MNVFTVTQKPPHGYQRGDYAELGGELYVVMRVMGPRRYECVLAPWYTRLHHRLCCSWHNLMVRSAEHAAARHRLRYEGRDQPHVRFSYLKWRRQKET